MQKKFCERLAATAAKEIFFGLGCLEFLGFQVRRGARTNSNATAEESRITIPRHSIFTGLFYSSFFNVSLFLQFLKSFGD